MAKRTEAKGGQSLAAFACPNPDCDKFNHFGAGNLSVVKLPEETVVRIIKCLGHGCSIEATADICEVDPRTVSRLLEKAGRRAEDFHRLQLERLDEPLQAVEMDELHARVSKPPGKRGGEHRAMALRDDGAVMGVLRDVASWVETGFMRLWPSSRGS